MGTIGTWQRSADRHSVGPDFKNFNFGFRLVAGGKASVMLLVYRDYDRATSVLGLNPTKCEQEMVNFMLKVEVGKPR